MLREKRYAKYLKKIDETHWADGHAAPWRCSHCSEKDGYYIKPATFYGEPVYDGNNYYLRFEINICPRCFMVLYGGFTKSKDLINWEQSDDMDMTVRRWRECFIETAKECQKAFGSKLKIHDSWLSLT